MTAKPIEIYMANSFATDKPDFRRMVSEVHRFRYGIFNINDDWTVTTEGIQCLDPLKAVVWRTGGHLSRQDLLDREFENLVRR